MKKNTIQLIQSGTMLIASGLLWLSCASEIHSVMQTPIKMVASNADAMQTRAGENIQSNCFDEGEDINAYITSSNGDLIKDTEGQTLYYPLTLKTKEAVNNINELTPTNGQPYFPAGNGKVNIFALYPSTVTSETSHFTVAEEQLTEDQYKASDLMYASVSDYGKDDRTANLRFRHLMAKIVMSVIGNGVTVTDVQMCNVYRTVPLTPSTGALNLEGLDSKGIIKLPKEGGAVLIPDQTITNEEFIKVWAQGYDSPAVISIADKRFHAGYQYLINMEIGPKNFLPDRKVTIEGSNWPEGIGTISVAAVGSSGLTIHGVNDRYDYDPDNSPFTVSTLKVMSGDTDNLKEVDPENYTVQYFDNEKSGTASVLVVGQGSYSGLATVKSFQIKRIKGTLSFQNSSLSVPYAMNGTLSNSDNPLTITGDGIVTLSSGDTNKATITPATIDPSATDASAITVNMVAPTLNTPVTISAKIAYGHGTNYYYGGNDPDTETDYTTSYSLSLTTRDVGNLIVRLNGQAPADYQPTYTTQAITPTVTVYDGQIDEAHRLTEGTHYTTPTFSNNTNVGKASVSFSGINAGGYSGTNSSTAFTIMRADPTVEMSTDGIVMKGGTSTTGNPHPVTVKIGTVDITSRCTITYTASPSGIVTVSSSGQITATASTQDSRTATITVSVAGGEGYNWNAPEPKSYAVTVMAETEWKFSWQGGTTNNGTVQSWPCPADGKYKLEAWGADGGLFNGSGVTSNGGTGGMASGVVSLKKGDVLYICIGRHGGGVPAMGGGNSTYTGIEYNVKTSGYAMYYGVGGYNGGGVGGQPGGANGAGGGGGATHIALGSTDRGVLANYKSYQSEILVAAGGGGGAGSVLAGGAGGNSDNDEGYGNPGNANAGNNPQGGGKSDAEGYQFGIGQAGYQGQGSNGGNGNHRGSGGGGGGWYGGYAKNTADGSNASGSGGGGSSYIKSTLENRTYELGANPDTNTSPVTSGRPAKNGYVRITVAN